MDSPNTLVLLPKTSDLSSYQLGFLNEHFSSRKDLSIASNIFADLSKDCAALDVRLLNLHRNFTKFNVSWISRSFAAKTAIQSLVVKLQNTSLYTSGHVTGSKKIQNILDRELPRLAKEISRMDNIRKYVETTLQLEALVGDVEDAVSCILNWQTGNRFSAKFSGSSTSASVDYGPRAAKLLQAVKAMNSIEDTLVNVVILKPRWCLLLRSADSRVDKTLAILRPQVLADHRSVLTELGWPPRLSKPKVETGEISGLPNPLVLLEGEKRKKYSESFLTLCAVQHLQTRRESRQLDLLGKKEQSVRLWAIDELVSPIASRFEHHFSKWVDHPEFVFALVYKTAREFIVGVDEILQPLIDRARLVSYSAKEAWVSSMVQTLSGFLARQIFPDLAERYKDKNMKLEISSLWLHLVALMVAFNKQMQSLLHSENSLFVVESENPIELSRSNSIFSVLCDCSDWLKIWGKIELKDAWQKIKSDLKNNRAWLIQDKYHTECTNPEYNEYLLSAREDYKAPLVAESALKIAWELIERGQNLPDISSRIQFIRLTAVRFLWHFFKVLVLHRKRVEFPPENPQDDAILRSCGSINAARYIESKLQEWSDDLNFLEMKIAENDSGTHKMGSVIDSCFFGEEIKSLGELQTNWLVEIISAMLREFETSSWEYFQNKELFEQELEVCSSTEVSAGIDLVVSSSLVEALDALSFHLNVLKMNLNPKDFLDLWRSIADGLDHYISHCILNSDIRFSEEGVIQFVTDIHTLLLVFQPFCTRPEAFFPCLKDLLMLFKMNEEEVKHLQTFLSTGTNAIKYLHSRGITHTSFNRVDTVLRNRNFRT